MAAGDYEKKQAREAEARHKRLQKIGDVVPPIGAPMGHKKKDVAKKMYHFEGPEGLPMSASLSKKELGHYMRKNKGVTLKK